jgi:hypothetical protein
LRRNGRCQKWNASTGLDLNLLIFALKYPDVKLTIHVTNRWVDVSEEPYAIRSQ